MASKKYKGKPCVYCVDAPSEDGDHIFSRKFFKVERRDSLPKVPACKVCNNNKSQLELYLAAVMPFGAKHVDAEAQLYEETPKRLEKNIKLWRKIENENKIFDDGFFTVPFDSDKYTELFRYIVKGLIFHHFNVLHQKDELIAVILPAQVVMDEIFNFYLSHKGNRVHGNLGDGTIEYEGLRAFDGKVTMWEFEVFGGLELAGDPDHPGLTTNKVIAMTGPKKYEEMFAKAFG
ncbi:hypothetical protein [Cellvibrio sp. PSBB006]|uniref:hypothetical protein n=1 Tax=Cellvibrio sp. PSBB006 TaxID=1987723 RepID=UPI000B3B66EF|nr:hypothetical protein [Cellvibrio sp. PSBB006]ARU29481.1 hypothetical protein CBR65_19680 [Cellvibrio sp. PSBB006]